MISQEVKIEIEIEITSDQTLIGTPFSCKNELYLITQNTARNYFLINYNMTDSFHRGSHELNPENTIPFNASRMFLFNNKISVFTGRFNKRTCQWKSALYYLDTEGLYGTWLPIPYCSFTVSKLHFDFDNSVSISPKDDEIIVVTGVNKCIIFRVFIRSAYGNKWPWASAIVTLPDINANFKIVSCTMILSDIYCLLQEEVNFYVCKFNIKITQQHQKCNVYARLAFTWHIKDDPATLERHHYISVYNEGIITISSHVIDNKGIFEVKQPELNSKNLAVQYRFEIPHVMTTVSALVVPCIERLVIAVIYRCSKTNKFHIKNLIMDKSLHKLEMVSHACIQGTSTIDSKAQATS